MSLKQEFREKTIGYILAALGLVAGLAWNDAIKSTIDQILPASSSGILIKFLYALVVTLFIVVISFYLIKFTEEKS